jgi:alkanesulfonate monooxygenase SsuD/methylene tetrahydromethanopterin reductase-like flavin-dependent oxidoreductase (luciferase family)/ribosomal protein S18 acetylase RimI-like enzyme
VTSNDRLCIREFCDDDAPAVAALWRRVFRDDSRWRAPEAVFARRRTRQRELFLVATLDGAVVGTTLAGYDGHRGWLYRVAVVPEEQRRGIGRALVREGELRLHQLGCPKINVQIEGTNTDVVRFYERLGYAVEDRVSMGKPLPDAMARARGRIDVGVYLPQVGFRWDELRDRVRLCDREGIHSVWFMDHLYPPGMPAVPSFEAWTTATALAACTERVRLGHLVLANGFRHPALLAKMAVTLDHASGGRLDLGLGSGSYPPEYRQFGLEFPSDRIRAERLDEALQVLKVLFTDDAPTFAGRHYRLDAAPSLPRPVQTPHPPIHVGGAGERRTLPLVARHADGWSCPTYALADLPRKLAVLHAACARIGRDPASVRVTEEAVLALVSRADEVEEARALALRRFPGPGWGVEAGGYCGTPDTIARRIEERARLGVRGFVFFLHDRAASETVKLLAREILPVVRAIAP